MLKIFCISVAFFVVIKVSFADRKSFERGNNNIHLGPRFASQSVQLSDEPNSAKVNSQISSDTIVIRRPFNVTGTIFAQHVNSHNMTITGDVICTRANAQRIYAPLISTDVLETKVIRSPTGTITIDGSLSLSGGTKNSNSFLEKTSFLTSKVIINGVHQWRLLLHDDFEGSNESEATSGWNLSKRTSCFGSLEDHSLGGHCVDIPGGFLKKEFINLPKHSHVRLKARVHFIDTWHGEAVFAMIDGHYVWSDSALSKQIPSTFRENSDIHGTSGVINVCGGPQPDPKLSTLIDVILPHNTPIVDVKFGSTLDASRDTCKQSWAIDDVMLYVR